MQYLVSVIHDTAGLATPVEMAAIDAFNGDRLKAEGHWVFAGGLGSPSTATVIDNRGGEAMFTGWCANASLLLPPGVAPGRYQILAAINAVHTSARDVRDTDWSQVLALYDQLVRLDPSPIIAVNRAIAVAELDGSEVALAAVDRLEATLACYHAYHVTRADLLRRLTAGRRKAAETGTTWSAHSSAVVG